MTPPLGLLSRRRFLGVSASCAAHLALPSDLSAGAPRGAWRRQERGRVVAREPWARIEELADGVWAVVSTPLEERTTLCNGAIVAGRDGVVVLEAFASPAGSRWVAEAALRLAGRPPERVVVSHYHGDHTAGLAGYAPTAAPARPGGGSGSPGPALLATAATLDLVRADDDRRQRPAEPARSALLDGATVLDPGGPTTLDLGGRVLRITPRSGHTASDVTVELDDPAVVLAGDLVWNGMFPNYVDAAPSALAASVRALVREEETLYVPGHGPLADAADLRRYLELLEHVEDAARRAFREGAGAAEAAERYRVPASLGEWALFSPRYYEVALEAWERELGSR